MTRSVDEVQNVIFSSFRMVHLNCVTLYCDAALALNVHVIQGLLLEVSIRNRTRGLKQSVRKGALTVVDVSYDAEVSDVFHVLE